LGKYVLRGYFDTDGCVVSMKRTDRKNQEIYPCLEMKTSPSPMQKQFIYLLNLYNFRFCKYPIEKKGRIHFRLNGKKQLQKWVNLIGFSNPKHLQKARVFLK